MPECPFCGKTWRDTKAERKAWNEDLKLAMQLLEKHGGGRPCDALKECSGHLEQTEVRALTNWNPSKVKKVRDTLNMNGAVYVSRHRPVGGLGAPILTWHRLRDTYI